MSGSPLAIPASHDVSLFPDHIDNIIFDLGDVLFTWSASTTEATLPSQTLKQILRSAIWYEYEKGNLSEYEAYARSAQTFGLAYADVAGAFMAARTSLRSDPVMLESVRKLKASGIQVYAMSNISAPDFDFLKTTASDSEWALFTTIFTSARARMRKPEVCFFRHVLSETGIDPARTVFVDDRLENVLSARSVGMQGIVHSTPVNTIQQLFNMCFEPIQRAHDWLMFNRGQFSSVTSEGTILTENFAPLLMLEVTGNKSLIACVDQPGQYNFFRGRTTELLPNDLDTTSLALTIKQTDLRNVHKIMDEMLSFLDNDGIIQVYFDHARPRIDPVVCANVLTLFHQYGRGEQVKDTLQWVKDVLQHRAYLSGTLYYTTPETFLFFLGRLIQSDASVRQLLGGLFLLRVCERFNALGDSLALAMRILAAVAADESLAILNTPSAKGDISHLRRLQRTDGSWRDGWFYKYGSSGILIKNDGVTTAFAMKAIKIARHVEQNH